MNESITRAAGSSHGQEWSPPIMQAEIEAAGRAPKLRNTLYGPVSPERKKTALDAVELIEIHNADAGKFQRSKSLEDSPVEAVLSIPVEPEFDQVVFMAASN